MAQSPAKHQGGRTPKYTPLPGSSATPPSPDSCLSPSPSPPSLLLNDCKASHFLSPITPAQYPRPRSKHDGTVRCLPKLPRGQRRKATARGRDQYGAFISRPLRAWGSAHLRALLPQRPSGRSGASHLLSHQLVGQEGFCCALGALSAQTGAAPSRHSQGRGVG